MSKGLVTKKSTKKEATKTMKEKKAAKRDKKNEKNNSGLLNKQRENLMWRIVSPS